MENIRNQEELQEAMNQGKPVLLDFYADWCGPCRALLPIVEDLAKEYDGQLVAKKVNVDNSRELASQFGVRSIPALFFIQDGKIVDTSNGLVSKNILEEKIKAVIQDKAA